MTDENEQPGVAKAGKKMEGEAKKLGEPHETVSPEVSVRYFDSQIPVKKIPVVPGEGKPSEAELVRRELAKLAKTVPSLLGGDKLSDLGKDLNRTLTTLGVVAGMAVDMSELKAGEFKPVPVPPGVGKGQGSKFSR